VLYDVLLEERTTCEQPNRLMIFNCMKGVKYEVVLDKKTELLTYLGDLMNHAFRRRTAGST